MRKGRTQALEIRHELVWRELEAAARRLQPPRKAWLERPKIDAVRRTAQGGEAEAPLERVHPGAVRPEAKTERDQPLWTESPQERVLNPFCEVSVTPQLR